MSMETKAEIPLSLFKSQDLAPLLAAYYEINHLKQLFRQGWLRRGVAKTNCESVAEHTFAMASMAMILADAYFPELDCARVLRMVLVHEFGEVYAGDITPADGVSEDEKRERERLSVRQICERLPQGESYLALWEEFEAGQTPEAQFVRQLDRLEMGLQAAVYRAQTGLPLAEFFSSAHQATQAGVLRDLVEQAERSSAQQIST